MMRSIGGRGIPNVSSQKQGETTWQSEKTFSMQMEDTLEDFSPEYAEGRFSVMYLTLKRNSVQKYLQIDIMADPETAKKPVPEDHLKNLAHFALWLFGNKKQLPLFADSRQVDNFNRILESPEAVRHLEESKKPNFDYAFQLARGDEPEIARLINEAADNIAISLSRVHHYKNSDEIRRAIKRLTIDFNELLERFPNAREKPARDD
jgi:hypothetical protein